ncbi:Protein FAM107B [Microtus ochrogaster]|uniref:Protein FAM107B n=1 Tax=Microtus ochrogaster TaxID=79684 RepID=A0A8J6KM22_MICOH|nr:Protein FAM107B [Microtus ochrogaster]
MPARAWLLLCSLASAVQPGFCCAAWLLLCSLASAVQPVLVLLLRPPVGFVCCREIVVTTPTACCTQPCIVTDSPLEDTDSKDFYLNPRNIMAEPDYIEDDNPELIRPQKLINPVKTSRKHQDLHRELLMNQKRGLAPQNKPELQKVMERRKRDQVIKLKEEEAQKKKSDLEIELLKRQQKLEQLELEKQKLQEEQENAPEFVKVKGNLRRTGQEVAQAQDS